MSDRDRDDNVVDATDKLRDKVVRDAGGTPTRNESGHGFLIGAQGKTDDKMFDFFARWLGADPEEMRRIAWEEGWGPDHERAERRRFEMVCQHCDQHFKAARPNASYCSARCRQRAWRERRSE
jgi:hypothetical protein